MQSLFLQIDITEIIVHKANQPDTVVDLSDAHSLTCERGAEIDFLFENADSSAAGDKSSPIVERIGEFSDAAIRPRGRFVDFGRVLHIESLMGARGLIKLFLFQKGPIAFLFKRLRRPRVARSAKRVILT